jgi:lysozyme family protein
MTGRFEQQIIPWLFTWEGTTYENDPDDPGGATKYGIDQRSHKNVDIRNLTAEGATQIYWDEYVSTGSLKMRVPMDWFFFNACVNCGKSRADKLMVQSNETAYGFLSAQKSFYIGLVNTCPTSKKYLRGWLNRLNSLASVNNVHWKADL